MRSKSAAICVVLSALVSSNCGGGDSGSPPMAPTPQPPSGPQPTTIAIVGDRGAQSFNPNPATAAQGTMLVFRNSDSVVHRIVFNDNSFDSGNINAGASTDSRAMPTNGGNYHCSIHPGMIGSISGSAGQPPPPCTGEYC